MCIFKNLNIEQTINYTAKKFAGRIAALKHIAQSRGFKTLENQPIELLVNLWREAKAKQDLILNDNLYISQKNE